MKIRPRAMTIPAHRGRLAEGLAMALLAASAGAPGGQVLAKPAMRALQLAQAGEAARRYDIAAQPLATALRRFQAIAGMRVRYDPAAIRGARTNGVTGNYSNDDVLRQLLAGTGLTYSHGDAGTITIERLVTGTATSADGVKLGTIDVEGEQSYSGAFEIDDGFKAEYQSSATKTPLTLRETPQAVSVITQDAIQARQATDISQALETAASVNQYSGPGPFGGMSPFGFNNFQIRGISSDGQLDLREDGFLTPSFYSRADLSIYERVEVVKGPSSVLYGQGSAGGFINQVRKKPLPEFQAGVEADIGSFEFYRAEGDITGPVYDSDAVRARLVTAYEDAGSFVDSVESQRLVFAPSVEFDLTDSTRLLVQGLYQEDRFIGNPGFPLLERDGEFVAPDIRRSLFVGVPNTEKDTWETKAITAQLEQRVTDNWLATLRMNRSSGDFPIDQDNYAYGIAPNGDVTLISAGFDPNTTDNWSGEFRLEGSLDVFGRPATVGFGVERYSVKTNRQDDAYITLGTANIYEGNFGDFPTVEPTEVAFNSTIETETTGVYAQAQARPLERLSVLAGGRYDWTDTSNLDNLEGALVEQEDRAFTGRVGLVFDVTDNVSAYALHAESFVPVSDRGVGGDILDPEEGKIYEVGVKTEWLDDRLGVNAAVFRIDRDNVAIPSPSGPGDSFSISSGVQRTQGVELEINGEPLKGWNLSLGASVLDSEFREESDPFFGSKPAGTADWQLGLFSSYELQGGALRGFGVGAGLYALGDRGVSTFVPGAQLAGYERVDLQAFYNGFERLNIALLLRNVLDETYVEGADRTGAYAQFGSPLAALLSVKYAFGQASDD